MALNMGTSFASTIPHSAADVKRNAAHDLVVFVNEDGWDGGLLEVCCDVIFRHFVAECLRCAESFAIIRHRFASLTTHE